MARIKPQALLQQSKKKKTPGRMSVATIITFSLIVFMVVFFLFSAYSHFSHRSVNRMEQTQTHTQSQTQSQSQTRTHGGPRKVLPSRKNPDAVRYATFRTSKGLITVELFKDGFSEVVDEFIDLCQKGHFKGMQFHRVIKHYVIQAGDVHSIGAAEEWTFRGKHYNQLDKSVKHEAFMLGTTKAKEEKKGFELYITTAPIPNLNDKINVFGQVIKGEDVVQEIEEVDTDDHYVPKAAISIMDVTLQEQI